VFSDKVTASEGIPVNMGPLRKVKESLHFENKIKKKAYQDWEFLTNILN
jgi:hypothetical protein